MVEQLGEAKLIGFGELVVVAVEKSFKDDIELAHPAPATPSEPVDRDYELNGVSKSASWMLTWITVSTLKS